MPMSLTIDYMYAVPVCALLIVATLCMRFFRHRQLPIHQNKIFAVTLLYSFPYLALMTAQAALFQNVDRVKGAVVVLVSLVYYIVQPLLASLLLAYVLTVTRKRKSNDLSMSLVVTFYGVIFVFLTPVGVGTRGYFAITESGVTRGSLIWAIHGAFIFAAGFTAVMAFRYRKTLREGVFRTLMGLSLLTAGSVVAEIFFPQMLLSGFALAMGLLLIYFVLDKTEEVQDPTTGLLNIDAMTNFIDELILQEYSYSVVIVKVENLKRINSVFGYSIGNRTLKSVAEFFDSFSPDIRSKRKQPEVETTESAEPTEEKTLSAKCGDGRAMDTALPDVWAFRLLSNQFAIVCASKLDQDILIDKVRARFKEPFEVLGMELRLIETIVEIRETSSFASGADLCKVVELVLPTVPKGDIVTIDEQKLEDISRQVSIEKELSRAIDSESFDIHLQPVFDVASSKFTMAEALVRFEHSQYGPLSPAEFMPIAEMRGLAALIDEQVLRKVCAFVRDRNAKSVLGLEKIGVNVALTDLAMPSYPKKVDAILKEYDVPHDMIVFEISETATEASLMLVERNIEILSTEGYGFALDNFGATGGNTSFVRALPFDYVKFDRAMLADAMESKRDQIVLENAIDLMRKMDVKTVVAGAETVKEADLATSCSVDFIQGAYYSRPLPPDLFVSYVKLSNHEMRKRGGKKIIFVQD